MQVITIGLAPNPQLLLITDGPDLSLMRSDHFSEIAALGEFKFVELITCAAHSLSISTVECPNSAAFFLQVHEDPLMLHAWEQLCSFLETFWEF